MAFRTLISTDALAAPPGRSRHSAIVDCRFKLDDVGWGEREWKAGHIPGAVYAHLDRDLSGPKTGHERTASASGVAALAPDPRASGHHERNAGRRLRSGQRHVREPSVVVAALAWPRRRRRPRRRSRQMDGGGASALRPTTERRTNRSNFSRRRAAGMTVDADEVAALRLDPDWRLVDSRAPERYRGEVEPMDPVAGHIPGAANHFFQQNLGERGTFRTPEDLRARFAPVIGGVAPEHVVLLLRVGRAGVPEPAGARARGRVGREAVSGVVERVVQRSVEASSSPSDKTRFLCLAFPGGLAITVRMLSPVRSSVFCYLLAALSDAGTASACFAGDVRRHMGGSSNGCEQRVARRAGRPDGHDDD